MHYYWSKTIDGSKGVTRDGHSPSWPNPLIFMKSSAKLFLKVFNSNSRGWHSPSGKSWICHWWQAMERLIYSTETYVQNLPNMPFQLINTIFLNGGSDIPNAMSWLVSDDSPLLSILKQSMLLIVVLISGVCAVGFWRGVWYLWDVHLWQEDPVKSAWFTFGLGEWILQCEAYRGSVPLGIRDHRDAAPLATPNESLTCKQS